MTETESPQAAYRNGKQGKRAETGWEFPSPRDSIVGCCVASVNTAIAEQLRATNTFVLGTDRQAIARGVAESFIVVGLDGSVWGEKTSSWSHFVPTQTDDGGTKSIDVITLPTKSSAESCTRPDDGSGL